MEKHVGDNPCIICTRADCADCPHSLGNPDTPWSTGLRQLYDEVVSEPLPDSFADLLHKLDQIEHD